jgi:hypothetical protein
MRMRLIATLVLICALFLTPTSGKSQTTTFTGNEFRAWCQQALVQDANQQTKKEALEATHCLGYLSGAGDVFKLWQKSTSEHGGGNPSPVCLPTPSVKVDDLVHVVLKFLNEHPNRLHEPYPSLVLAAFSDAYPCKR